MKHFNLQQYLARMLRKQRGLSMVELLVALVLSTILLGGIIQLFIGSKQTYRFHDALSRLQENGRFALDIMSNDIRMADYNINPTVPIENPLRTNGTDANGNDDITVGWRAGDTPDIRVYSVGAGGANAVRTCAAAANSLYLDNGSSGGSQELIEGVQQMQLLYGVCDANGVVQPPYVNTAGVGNWDNVCSVRINLLLVSTQDRVVTEPQAVFFPSSSANAITPTDHCLRQVFSTTVAVRNRILSTRNPLSP